MMVATKDRPIVVDVRVLVGNRRAAFIPYALLALLIAIPCFWQEHIQSVDLSSHLYNAWLVNEVTAGHLPGLHVATQYTNVVFDLMLSFLMRHTGSVVATERIAVVIAVQIFFWGCFAFVSAASSRRVWPVTPLLAMLTYGVVYRIGFFNFYISTGLCCFALALVWKKRWPWLAAGLLALAFLAHLLPCIWAGGVMAYLYVARRLHARYRLTLLGASALTILALSGLVTYFVPSLSPSGLHVDSLFGVDQMLMWGAKYRVVAAVCFFYYVLVLIRRFDRESPLRDISFQLWVLSALACLFLPDAVWMRFYTSGLSYITIRLSLFCAIFLLPVIATVPLPRLAHVVPVLAAVVFFSLTYLDERSLNAVEGRMQAAVSALPAGVRVLAAIHDPRLYVQGLEHMIDRPCIGRCFDYGNYEASTSQFRLRPEAGNFYVLADNGDIGALEHGKYVFWRKDLQVYKLFPCDEGKFCSAPLVPGELVASQQLNSLAARRD